MLDRVTAILRTVTILCLLGLIIPNGCHPQAGKSNLVAPPTTSSATKIAVIISVINEPAGPYLRCSIENHGDQQIILGDKIDATWVIENKVGSKLLAYHSGYWHLPPLSLSHYAILQPIPPSRRDTGFRIDTDQLSWKLPLDELKSGLESPGSGTLNVSIFVLCSTDLYPRGFSTDVDLNLPLVDVGVVTKEFVPDNPVPATEYRPPATKDTTVEDIIAELKAKRDKELGTK